MRFRHYIGDLKPVTNTNIQFLIRIMIGNPDRLDPEKDTLTEDPVWIWAGRIADKFIVSDFLPVRD